MWHKLVLISFYAVATSRLAWGGHSHRDNLYHTFNVQRTPIRKGHPLSNNALFRNDAHPISMSNTCIAVCWTITAYYRTMLLSANLRAWFSSRLICVLIVSPQHTPWQLVEPWVPQGILTANRRKKLTWEWATTCARWEDGGWRYPMNQSAERTYPGGKFRYCSTRTGGHPSRPNGDIFSPPHFAKCSGHYREGHEAQCKKAGGIHLHDVT